ncbi:MAG: hypothetical protein ABI438_00045 [Dermatophilaceae bacterium]
MIIRPSFTVISGAALGLVAGAAVYGAVSSAATPSMKTTKAAVSVPAAVAHCAKGQKLEDGVCVIHVVRTLVVPAPAAAQVPTGSQVSDDSTGAQESTGPSASGDDASEAPGSAIKAPEDTTKVGDDAMEEKDDAEGTTDDSSADDGATEAVHDDSMEASH